MSMMNEKEIVGYLLFNKVPISNANTISSPMTYGFPAVTGFLGAFHAMSRKMAGVEALRPYCLGGVLLACHDCQPQFYRASQYSNYTFNQSRNPIKRDGKTASIIEEGKCHLTMSFVVEVLGEEELSAEEKHALTVHSQQWIQQQRIAGGSVHALTAVELVHFVEAESINDVIPLLLPAFVLMDARDDFAEIIAEVQQENPQATPLDALLDVCTLHHIPEMQNQGQANEKTTWVTTSKKTGRGWLVPMPIGYQGISDVFDAGVMQNVRNPEYRSQYVEAIYSLGKWVYPQRLHNCIETAFWRYHHDAVNALYLVSQNN